MIYTNSLKQVTYLRFPSQRSVQERPCLHTLDFIGHQVAYDGIVFRFCRRAGYWGMLGRRNAMKGAGILIGICAIGLDSSPLVRATPNWIVNPASETLRAPAILAANTGTPNGPIAITVDERAVPADVWNGRLYLLAEIPPLHSAAVKHGSSPFEQMTSRADEEGLTVRTDRGSWRFTYGRGLVATDTQGRAGPMLECELGRPIPAFVGSALVVVRDPQSPLTFYVYRNGLIEIDTAREVAFRWAADTPWEFSCAAHFGYAIRHKGGRLASALDWIRLGNTPGLHVGVGSGAGTVAPDHLRYHGRLRLLPGVDNTWNSVRAQAALREPAVLNTALGGVPGSRYPRLRVLDRNKDNVPDFHADAWLFPREDGETLNTVLGFSEYTHDLDGEPDVLRAYRLAGKRFDEVVLTPGAGEIDKYSIYFFEADKNTATPDLQHLPPALTLVDWNDDGQFFIGSLFDGGGYLQQDMAFFGPNEIRAYDLDGDGDVDLSDWYPGSNMVGTQFDLEDRFIGMIHARLIPDAGVAEMAVFDSSFSFMMNELDISWYNKTYEAGKFYGDVRIGFEEHINMIVPDNVSPHFPRGARLFLKTTNENVDRMTFGHLGGRTNGFAWTLELDPLEADRLHPSRYEHLLDYRDPWGHPFRALSVIYPPSWDGGPLKWEPRPEWGNAVEIYPNAPWYRTTTGRYFPLRGLRFCIAPEGGFGSSNEGMYGGQLSHEERIEEDSDGATFFLYYSSLMGGLHLKGADWGTAAYPPGWPGHWWKREQWYHFPDGIVRKGRFMGNRDVSQPACKRLEGIFFLTYTDQNKDGYFDTYVYDRDNDGINERTLWYDISGGFVVFQEGPFRAAWPYRADIVEVEAQMANHGLLRDLYRRGYREEPFVERFSLSSSGIPIERRVFEDGPGLWGVKSWRPEFYAIFGPEWIPQAGIFEEEDSTDRFTWKDFRPTGFTRLGTLVVQQGMVQTIVRKRLTPETLAPLAVLFIGHLSHVPDKREMAALLEWIEQGGVLVLNVTQAEEADRLYFNAVGEHLGFALGERIENRTRVTKLGTMGGFTDLDAPFREERAVTPENRVAHYRDAMGWNLLDGLDYLTFVGYPLTLTSPMQPLLEYQGRPIAALAEFGSGLILVAGANLFSDGHAHHSDTFEPGARNDTLLQRLVARLTATVRKLEVKACEFVAGNPRGKPPILGTARVAFSGRGGDVFFPQMWLTRTVRVNGDIVTPTYSGALSRVHVPAGDATIEIVQQEEQP